MNRKQILNSIDDIDIIIEMQLMIKSQLQETVLKDSFDKLWMWKHKRDNTVTAYIVGINTDRKEITVNTPHHKEILFGYGEFLHDYIPASV